MPMKELRRSWVAAGPLDLVVAATEPARLPEVHPLVRAVSNVRADGSGERWTTDEGVPLGIFTIPNRYETRREVTGPRVRMEAWSRPSVHLVHTLDLTEGDGVTTVEHVVQVEAPRPVFSFVWSTAEKAHDEWVARVCTWVAAQAVRRTCGGEAGPCLEPYRGGTWLVRGTRSGWPWEVLVSRHGVGFVRFPGVAGTVSLAPPAAFGRGGLSGEGYTAVATGPLAGWRVRGSMAEVSDRVVQLLGEGDGSIVDGALVITRRDAEAVIRSVTTGGG